MSNEMIERIVKVVSGVEGCKTNCSHCRKIAKAAIAAMREPTEEMLIAGHCTTASDHLEMGYQAMIDAALKEDEDE